MSSSGRFVIEVHCPLWLESVQSWQVTLHPLVFVAAVLRVCVLDVSVAVDWTVLMVASGESKVLAESMLPTLITALQLCM